MQPPFVQMPPEQIEVPQHCEDAVQEAPAPLQPPLPEHTPPEHVEVPQHCEDAVQKVPGPWHTPPEHTLLELHCSTPQQSALEPQR